MTVCDPGEHTMKKFAPAAFRWVAKEELLQRIGKGVCEFMALCANLEVQQEYPPPPPDGRTPVVMAVIAFEGDYLGVVWARCSKPLAVRVAAGMLGTGAAAIDENVSEALGAMINILGGDVKLFLCHGGGTVNLSLPCVSQSNSSGHSEFTDGPESVLCSFLHGKERLLVGLTLRKAQEEPLPEYL